MKIEIKKIIDEIIYLRSNWRTQNFDDLLLLKKVIRDLGAKEVYFSVGPLLSWLSRVDTLDEDEIDQDYNATKNYYLTKFKGINGKLHDRTSKFYNNCPEIRLFLDLQEDKVSFNKDLTEDDRNEIVDYVKENRSERAHYRIRI